MEKRTSTTKYPASIAAFLTLCLVGCSALNSDGDSAREPEPERHQSPRAVEQTIANGANGSPATDARAAGPLEPSHHPNIVVVAHRGGIVAGIPENTLAAYRHAMDTGVDAIEIDLRGTVDGEVVVMHDETVDRTTDGVGRLSDMTVAELKRLDAGGGERIPTYEEVLELVAGRGVAQLLDIKESPTLDKRRIVRLTERHGALLNVIVGAGPRGPSKLS